MRAQVQDVGAARWLVVLGVGALLTVCAGSSTRTAPAQITDAADCAVRETLASLGTGGGEDLPVAPRAGRVPDGFAPVAAVECRRSEVRLVPAPEPPRLLEPGDPPVPGGDLGTARPAAELPGAAGATSAQAHEHPLLDDVRPVPAPPVSTSVDVVRLEGDLHPLLEQLVRRDVPARPDLACMAVFEVVPVLYLVDADDRAVRVRWPTDACGFLLDGARESLAGLREAGRTAITVP